MSVRSTLAALRRAGKHAGLPVWLSWLLLSPAAAQPGASTAAAAEPPAAAASVAAATVEVSRFELLGARLLPPERLQAVLAPWLGRRTLAELQQAAAAVQAEYARAGFGAVATWLPPQGLGGGVVRVQVLEGKLARVQVKGQGQGAQRWSDERVRAALPSLQPGLTPRLRLLDAELQLANDLPARRLGLLLAPGAAPGEVDATVTVQERRRWQGQLSLDNSGNRNTGWWRLGGGLQLSDLAGRDDLLSVQAQVSPTQAHRVKVFSLGYRWPVPGWRSALEGYAAWSSVNGGAQASAAGDVRLAGRGRIYGLRLGHVLPRVGRFDQRLHLGLEQRDYLNQCAVEGLPDGACGPAGASVRVQPLTLDYSAQSGGPRALGVTVSLARNLALGGDRTSAASFDALRSGARVRYAVLRAALNGRWALGEPEGAALAGRLSLQLSPQPLVPGEQFGLGGAASVRGYLERELLADRGVQLSAEWISPRLAAELLGEADLRALLFLDAGALQHSDGATCLGTASHCQLASVGLGARLDQGSTALRLSAARALREGVSTQQGDWRGHLSLQLAF